MANAKQAARSTGLLKGSIKFLTIVLMVTAAAAPLVVASSYVPLSIGFGSGVAVPLTYLIGTVILLIFSIGFVAMARKVTSAGAFYTFTAVGLGKPLGLGAGFTIVASYSMIAVAIQGGFGYFASNFFATYLGLTVPWWVCSIVSLLIMFALSYFRVTLTARVLGILLGAEVIVTLIVVLATIFQGGAEGQSLEPFNPAALTAAPAIGIGLFFAFWSWIGFETTAIYGEETVDPRKSVPKATYIAVITLGVFYMLVSYASVIGYGVNNAVAEAGTNYGTYFFTMADMYTIPPVRFLLDLLVVTGFFACSFAFTNNATRYFYSLGRDRILPSGLGHTHPKYKSPVNASLLQTIIAIVTVVIFVLIGADPLLELGTWLPLFCTLGVIFVQFLVSLAVIGYFNKEGRKGAGAYWKTLIAPILGALAQGFVAFLLIQNLGFLAASDALVVTLIPVYVAVIAVIGIVYALILRARSKERYELIGNIRDEDFIDILPET